MIIVLLLFFNSICLYCQRLVLYVHDRWINPKNVRLLKEAAEAQGTKFQIEEYRQAKKSKKRRYATNSLANNGQNTNTLADSDNCRFCANTPQGYCRHHFHLQELHVQKQQRQQKFWCPLSGVVAGPKQSTDYRQLRKIKRELKRNIQHQQQLKLAKTSSVLLYEQSSPIIEYPPTPLTPTTTTHQNSSENSSYYINDSGYQTLSVNASSCLDNEESDLDSVVTSYSCNDYVDIDLSSPSTTLVETTYSFETCFETPNHSASAIPRNSSLNSFMSCEYSTLSTSYL